MNSYKSCVMDSISESLYFYLDDVDNRLNKCMHDYYDKPEDCDMLRDTMDLFVIVKHVVNSVLGCGMSDNQVSMMVEDLIAREIRECEEIPCEKKSNSILWQEYREVLEDNIDKNVASCVREVRRVKKTIATYTTTFDTNYLESQDDNEYWQEIALVYPQTFK